MTAKTNQQDELSDDVRFRYELADEIDRFIAKSLQLWTTCENRACRRAKACASRNFECIAKRSESLPPCSPEQERAKMIEVKKVLAEHIRLRESGAVEQIAEAVEKEKAARRAAMAREASGTPAPVVGTQRAPEGERIDRARNDGVKEPDGSREPGPRIRRL